MSKQNTLDQLLTFVNCINIKKKAASLICYGEIIDLKILQSDWLRALWSMSQEQDFSQILDLGISIANNINFIIEQIH